MREREREGGKEKERDTERMFFLNYFENNIASLMLHTVDQRRILKLTLFRSFAIQVYRLRLMPPTPLWSVA